MSLCTEYNVDAESFIEQWMAFSLTVLNGASPTLENLELLAKREFSKRSASRPNALPDEVTNSSTGTSLTVYGAHAAIQYPFKTYPRVCFKYIFVLFIKLPCRLQCFFRDNYEVNQFFFVCHFCRLLSVIIPNKSGQKMMSCQII